MIQKTLHNRSRGGAELFAQFLDSTQEELPRVRFDGRQQPDETDGASDSAGTVASSFQHLDGLAERTAYSTGIFRVEPETVPLRHRERNQSGDILGGQRLEDRPPHRPLGPREAKEKRAMSLNVGVHFGFV